MIFRRVFAGPPTGLPATQFAANSRPAETATAATEICAPNPDDAYIFEVLGFLNANPGPITKDTPGLPTPPNNAE